MSTDAKALYDFLFYAITDPEDVGATYLSSYTTRYLGYHDDDVGEAILAIQGLAFRVSQAVQALTLPKAQKETVQSYLLPLLPLVNFATYKKNVTTLRNDFLVFAKVGQLLIINSMLEGSEYEQPDIDVDDNLLEEVTRVTSAVLKSSLHEGLKDAILQKLRHIEIALRNVEVFGAKTVLDDIIAILGVVAVAEGDGSEGNSEDDSSVLQKVKSFSHKALSKVRSVRKIYRDYEFLADAAAEVAGLLEDHSDAA